MANQPLVIEYYSDVLCVWAWIAQRRVEELCEHFGDAITLEYSYVDIFGDVPSKMENQWQAKGGYQAFAQHVHSAVDQYECAPVNEKLWRDVIPTTSANAHLMLKAVALTQGDAVSIDMGLQIRKAFFCDAKNIGHFDVLYELAMNHCLDCDAIKQSINDGSAMAALMGDYQLAKSNGVKGSPSYVLDGGRQTLYGNVGYRVLKANIEELLRRPADEASWC